MADKPISIQELIDAQKDASALKDAINGNETGIVNPRLNDPYSTLPAAIQKIESDGAAAIAKLENTGGFISAPTLTALQAITPEYDYQLARVDETGDEYRWNPALTTTVKWEPTGRNFLSESKAYTDESIAQNLLFDPFNETVAVDRSDALQSIQNAEFSSIVTSSAFNKPALRSNAGVQARRYLDVSKMRLNTNKFYVRIHANYQSIDSTSVISAYLRKSDNSIIAQKSVFATVGDNDVILDAITSTDDAHHLLIICAGAGIKDLNAVSVSLNPKPKLIYGSVYANYYKEIQSQIAAQIALSESKQKASTINLIPDAFFRAYSAGVKSIDGFPLINESENLWSVVDYAASQFIAKKAIFKTSGSSALNRSISFKRLGLQAGDTLTFRTGITTATDGNFQIAFYVRKADNTVVGSTASSQFSMTANMYRDLSHTVTITQAMIDEGVTLNIRMNVAATLFANGWYCSGMALYRNNTTTNIQDNSYEYDALRVLAQTNQLATTETPHDYGASFLRETHLATMKRKLNESAKLSIALIGDSWTQNRDRYALPVLTSLLSLGDGGGGWLGFSNHPDVPSLINGNVRTSYDFTKSGAWSSIYYTTVSPDLGSISSSEVGAKITVNMPSSPTVSSVDLFYVATADGQIRYRINGGSWNVLSLVGTAGNSGRHSITGFTTGAQTLEIEVVSGACTLSGCNIKSTADGVVVHKLGSSGSNTAQWVAVNAQQWQNNLAALEPKLVTIMHGTNDQTSGRSPAALASNTSTMIDRIKAATPKSDICIIMPCENLRTNNTVAMSDYAKAAYEVCKTKKVAFLDLQTDFGFLPADYADKFSSDLIHADPLTGGRLITYAILRFIFGGFI